MKATKTRGFTLIELLVVIAILAVLIAILIPSLALVRRRAKTASCLTNTRSMEGAVNYYVADFKRMIPFTGNPADSWTQLLGKSGSFLGGSIGYGLTEKVRICPEALYTSSNDPAIQPWYGAAHFSWGNSAETGNDPVTNKPYIASYGLNAYTYAASSSAVATIGITTANAMYSLPLRGFDARVPVFSDAIWRHVVPKPSDNPGASLDDPGPQSVTNLPMSMILMNRHDKAINVSFADGHAETVKLPALYGLYWSKNWVPRNPVPPFPAN